MDMPHRSPAAGGAVHARLPWLSRRRFLAGAAAASVLAACGDGSPDGASPTSLPPEATTDLSVVRFFGPFFAAGSLARVPIGLADTDGLLPREAAPTEIRVDVTAPDGTTAAEDLVSPLYGEGLPRAYYAFEFTPEVEGFYDISIDTGDGELVSQVQIVPGDDPVAAALVQPGDRMPELLTPTVADARGVDPICTRTPPCHLHEITLADALDTGPVVLLVSTPAFCQISICGPVLDVMLDLVPDHPDIAFVHAEVYREPEANQVPPVPSDHAPVVSELGLPFEPVLYTVGADGVVRDRLDYIFDGVELSTVIDRLT